MSVFDTVKRSITTRQAAEQYGFKPDKGGKICCPFHPDKHPSMKVDDRYYCFGCQATGDVIDFTAKLFSLTPMEAANKLAADFGITGFGKGHDPPQKLPVKKQGKDDEAHYFRILCDYFHLLRHWKTKYAPTMEDADWHPLFVEALQKYDLIEYLLDILIYGDEPERASLLTEYRKEVNRIERRIADHAAGADR